MNTIEFDTNIQHTLGNGDFSAKAQQPLFAFCNDNTLDAGLDTFAIVEGVPTARLTLRAMLGSPRAALAPRCEGGDAGRELCSAGHLPGRLVGGQGGRRLRRARCCQAPRAAEGQGCRALRAPALRRGVEKHFLLGIRLRKGLNQGRSPMHTQEQGGPSWTPRSHAGGMLV